MAPRATLAQPSAFVCALGSVHTLALFRPREISTKATFFYDSRGSLLRRENRPADEAESKGRAFGETKSSVRILKRKRNQEMLEDTLVLFHRNRGSTWWCRKSDGYVLERFMFDIKRCVQLVRVVWWSFSKQKIALFFALLTFKYVWLIHMIQNYFLNP